MARAQWLFLATLCLTSATGVSDSAAEPNEAFLDATLLAPGVTVVSDDITGSPTPIADTTLGAFDELGGLIEADDDNSSFGNGLASGLYFIPVNADGSIELAVSGFEDFDFDGIDDSSGFGHGQAGAYELYIDIYDASGAPLDFVYDLGDLTPGTVDLFSFSAPTWIGGSFNAEINNLVDFEPGDIDFYRFTGLTPGLPFVAEVIDGDFDTVLGLYDDITGELLEFDDDDGDGFLSLLSTRLVPASGEIVLAVSGFNDFDFIGAHSQFGEYTLSVSTVPEPMTLCLAACALPLMLTRRRQG